MDDEIQNLRGRIEQVSRGVDGRRIFTAAIRKDVVALGEKWKASGGTVRLLAESLGLDKTTLHTWLNRPHSKGRRPKATRTLRRVEVDREVKATTSTATPLVVVLRSGVRVEGLAIDDAIKLARALA